MALDNTMNSPPRTLPGPLPRWVILGGSGLIVFHFLAVGAVVLAAPSGPWPMNFGAGTALGPPFAAAINQFTAPRYLRPLHMTQDYHFASNVSGRASVFFEVHLKDQAGKVVKTLKFPDDKASFYVRHRQRLLAQGLDNDLPVQPPQGEQVFPSGQGPPTVHLWHGVEGDPILRLTKVSELELPRNRPLSRPSEGSVLLAQAYARYLCREHGAASAEVVRHSRNALLPDILFVSPVPAEAFTDQVCIFGEYRP